MHKLTIALGSSAGLLLAGGMAWKADAMTWRSGTLNLPSAAKNYSPVEKTACGGWGTALPAGIHLAVWSCALLVQALLTSS